MIKYFKTQWRLFWRWVTWDRDPETTLDLLELADAKVPISVIWGWTNQQMMDAEEWAGAAYMRANDNIDVKVPPVPEHVKPYYPSSHAPPEN